MVLVATDSYRFTFHKFFSILSPQNLPDGATNMVALQKQHPTAL